MSIQIRQANESDFEVVQQLSFLLFKKEQRDFDDSLKTDWPFSPVGENYFRRVLTGETGRVWLAIVDNRAVAFLIGTLSESVPTSRAIKKRIVLNNMFVLKEYRNKGIGGKLVKEFIAWAKQEKADNIRVTAFAGNKKAIEFYRRCGFYDYNHTLEMNL